MLWCFTFINCSRNCRYVCRTQLICRKLSDDWDCNQRDDDPEADRSDRSILQRRFCGHQIDQIQKANGNQCKQALQQKSE